MFSTPSSYHKDKAWKQEAEIPSSENNHCSLVYAAGESKPKFGKGHEVEGKINAESCNNCGRVTLPAVLNDWLLDNLTRINLIYEHTTIQDPNNCYFGWKLINHFSVYTNSLKFVVENKGSLKIDRIIDIYQNQLSYVTLRERFLRPKSLSFWTRRCFAKYILKDEGLILTDEGFNMTFSTKLNSKPTNMKVNNSNKSTP